MVIEELRISLVVRLEDKAEGEPALEPEHDPVVAERERGPVEAELVLDPGAVLVPSQAAGLALDPVAAKQELARVEVELELSPAEALELDPVEVEPGHARVAVLPKNKSATAARHRDRVAVAKRVEDLAAAAETTREPAVTEVAVAWVAAGTAGVVAAE